MTLGIVWTECAIWRGKSANLIPTRSASVDLVFLHLKKSQKNLKKLLTNRKMCGIMGLPKDERREKNGNIRHF
jgi:hypothetical protein